MGSGFTVLTSTLPFVAGLGVDGFCVSAILGFVGFGGIRALRFAVACGVTDAAASSLAQWHAINVPNSTLLACEALVVSILLAAAVLVFPRNCHTRVASFLSIGLAVALSIDNLSGGSRDTGLCITPMDFLLTAAASSSLVVLGATTGSCGGLLAQRLWAFIIRHTMTRFVQSIPACGDLQPTTSWYHHLASRAKEPRSVGFFARRRRLRVIR